MDNKELFAKISDVLEKVGVKAALKNPEVIETIYNVMTKYGMKVDKGIFSIVMFGIANSEKLDIGALMNLGSGLMGATAPQQQATQQPQSNAANAANMLGALGALGAMTGALGGAQQQPPQQQQATQQQAQQPNPLDAINAIAGIANALGGTAKK